MRLEKVRIKGFRNFDDTEVIFQKKTLIIGANDVGKSNLIYALRILFDKTIAFSIETFSGSIRIANSFWQFFFARSIFE